MVIITTSEIFKIRGKWFVSYTSHIRSTRAGWTDGPYRWRWVARFKRWLTMQHLKERVEE